MQRNSLALLTQRLSAACGQYANTYGNSTEEDPRNSIRKKAHEANNYGQVDVLNKIIEDLIINYSSYTSDQKPLQHMQDDEKYALYKHILDIIDVMIQLDAVKGSMGSALENFLNDKGRFGVKLGQPSMRELITNVIYDLNPELKSTAKKMSQDKDSLFNSLDLSFRKTKRFSIREILQKDHGIPDLQDLKEIISNLKNGLYPALIKQLNDSFHLSEAKEETKKQDEKENQIILTEKEKEFIREISTEMRDQQEESDSEIEMHFSEDDFMEMLRLSHNEKEQLKDEDGDVDKPH